MILWTTAVLLLLGRPLLADDTGVPVTVAAPYIDMHTGPGRGYPVFHVIEKTEAVTVLKRRTDWYKVRDRRGREGWVSRQQMSQTFTTDGRAFVPPTTGFEDYLARRWEFSGMGGDFAGANALTLSAGYWLSGNLVAELMLEQATGNFSDSLLATVGVYNQPFPEWRVSPYFGIGAGAIKTDPSSTLVATEDRTDAIVHAAVGARVYLTRRFLFRAEYRHHMILTSRNENEAIDEWKIGFSVFF
jgi:hypothetical protein